MHCTLLFLPILIGTSLCVPRPDNAELLSDSSSSEILSTTKSSSNRTVRDKVQLTVYYETLCGASQQFLVEKLKPAIIKLGTFIDLQLLPYGNANTILVANTTDQYKFDCQHGASECYGNMVHACAIDVIKNITKAALFNSCLIARTFSYKHRFLSQCAEEENITSETVDEISHCTRSARGNALMKSIGDITRKDNADYVPHLTIDGSPNYEHRGRINLIDTVCDILYPKPQECPSDDDDFMHLFDYKK